MAAPGAAPIAREGAGRRRKRILVAALALLAAVALLEGALRFALFSERMRGTALAERLRRCELYATAASADYWKLHVRFGRPRAAERRHPLFDARLGWRSEEIDPVTFAHADEARLGDRRPVLLFGDSYAQCVDRAGDCWEELLERSDLASRFALLNYGVGGYGLDQAVLLARHVVPRFAERAPVVVMAILVDDDLDRCFMRLRGHPKPWFALEGEQLAAHPPAAETPLAFVDAEPPAVRSYLGRWLLFGSGRLSPDTAERWAGTVPPLAEREALCRRILVDFRDDMDARGLDSFFLLFHGEAFAAPPDAVGWQEPFLQRALAEERMPYVSSKPRLRAHAKESSVGFDAFYYTEGRGLNHFNELGNRVAFEALRQGLLGNFEPRP